MNFQMKNYKLALSAILLAVVVGFSSCSSDDDEVELKTVQEYKTELSTLVAAEKEAVKNCKVGYNKGDFRSELNYADYTYNYMAALVSAEAVLAKSDLTIAQIFAANKSLSAPGKLFNDNIFISDRRPIHELIVFSDTLRVRTPVGTLTGQVSAEAKNTFTAAISKAKTTRSAASTIERQVTEAVDKLKIELEAFQKAIIK